jgi:hypothetical protein
MYLRVLVVGTGAVGGDYRPRRLRLLRGPLGVAPAANVVDRGNRSWRRAWGGLQLLKFAIAEAQPTP